MPQRDRPAAPDIPGPPRLLTALVTACTALFVVLSIGSPLAGTRVFHATEMLRLAAPWNAAAPTGAPLGNICVSDTVDAVLPALDRGAAALRHGRLDGWAGQVSGGSSLAVGQDAGLFSPVTLPPYLLLPAWLAPAYAKLLELIVSIGGMVLFARSLGLRTAAGLVGGVVYAGSGFLVVWTNWPQAAVAAFIPAVFWALERLCRGPSLRGALLLALPVAAMLLGGFPAVTGWTLYAAGTYLAVRLLADRRRLRLPGAAAAAGLAGFGVLAGIGLAAFELLPAVHSLLHADLSSRAAYARGYLPLQSATSALFPNGLGGCGDRVGYFGPVNQVETATFVGTGALVLALIGLTARRTGPAGRGARGYLAGLAAVCGVLVFVGGPLLRLAVHLPVFSNNPDARLRVLIGFAAAGLAALGLDRVLAGRSLPRRTRRAALAHAAWAAPCWAAAAGAAALAARSVHRAAFAHHVSGQLDRQTWLALGVAGGVAALALLGLGARRLAPLAVLGISACVLAQSYAFAHPFWPREPRSAFYPRTPTHGYLDQVLGEDRYGSSGIAMWPGTSLLYGQRAAGGHGYAEPAWVQALAAADPAARRTPTYLTLDATPAVLASPILDRLSVAYFVADPAEPVPGTVLTVGGAGGTATLGPGAALTSPAPDAALRAVGVQLRAPLPAADVPWAAVRVQLLAPDGSVVGGGSRRLYQGAPAGAFVVPITQAPAGAGRTVRITLDDGPHTAELAAAGGVPQLTVTEAPDDGLRLVFTDDAVVYQRQHSLRRFRWADRVVAEPDPAARLALLGSGQLPADAVLMDRPATAAGQPAQITVERQSNSGEHLTVDAAGQGFLVVADADQSGWTATVDGHRATLLPADHALVAVSVPAGRHTVVLHVQVPSQRAGLAVSAGTLTGCLLLAAAAALRGRLRPVPYSPVGRRDPLAQEVRGP